MGALESATTPPDLHRALTLRSRPLVPDSERSPDALVFPEAVFDFEPDDGVVDCAVSAGANPNSVEHLLVDQVLPRVAASGQYLVLHASAVLVGDAAVLFLGASGAGKSTLAMGLHLAGFPHLSDDCAVIALDSAGSPMCWGSYPGARVHPDALDVLWPDGAPPTSAVAEGLGKRRVALAAVSQPVPVAAIVDLHREPAQAEVACKPLTGASIALKLLQNSFAPATGYDEYRMEMAVSLARETPIVSLSYPRSVDGIRKVSDALPAIVEGLRRPSS